MANCVNVKSKEFKALAKQSNINPIILAAKVSLWQESNGLDKFPTLDEINDVKEQLKINQLKIKQLRAQEKQEFEDNVPNARSYIVKGKIDAKKVKTSSNLIAKEIYAKYDKLLSPLLETIKKEQLSFQPSTEKENILKEMNSSFFTTGGRRVPLENEQDFLNKEQEIVNRINAKYDLNLTNLFTLEFIKTPVLNKIGGQAFYRYNIIESAFNQIKKLEDFSQEAVSQNTYNGQIYNSQEQLNRDKKEGDQLSLFNPTVTVATNYTSIINFKNVVLKQINKRLEDAQQKSRTDKSPKLKQEIRELFILQKKINKDISDLINDPDIFERTMSIFNNDIAFMKSLIATPTLENLHLAETYIDYFKSISDYSGANISNTFIVDTSDPNLIDPEIRKVLDKLTVEIQNAEGDIVQAKKDYLLEIIDDSDILKTMFGNDAEEIRDIILAIDKNTKEQTQKDLDKFSKYLLSADTSMGTKDLLGQLIVNVLKEKKASTKVEANQFIQAISNIEDKVKQELSKLGFGITYFSKLPLLGKHISEVSYDLFYQKTSKGNKTGRLIGKFAHKWFHDISNFLRNSMQELDSAIANGDISKANQILSEKYNWLNDRVDFIEIGKLPEIINNPNFSMFSQYFNTAEAAQYSADLKAKIGEYEYKKIIEQQITFLEQYVYNLTEDLNELMQDHQVSTPAQLPMNVVHHYNVSAKRKNPFEFIISHNSGQQGRVDYMIGQTGNQYQSLLNYNTYIPKQTTQKYNALTNTVTATDSGYYDSNFSTIENNPVLLEFWGIISEATEWMNNNLNDANTPLNHNSMLRMEKSILDVLLSKNTGILNKALFLNKSTASVLKSLFTKPIRNISESEKVALRNIQTLQGPVESRFNTILMALSNATGTKITSKSSIDLNTLSPKTVAILQKITELPLNTIKSQYGDTFEVGILREILTNQVMEEQTFNLPVMLRAYLDATGTYKAQKEALPMVNILKDLYEDIKAEAPQVNKIVAKTQSAVAKYTGRKKDSSLQNRRVNAEQRMNYWVEKAVKNRGEENMSNLQYYWGKLGKTYTSEEKLFLKQAKEYLTQLKQNLVTAEQAVTNYNISVSTPTSKSLVELEEEREAIKNEIEHIEHIIDHTGHYYALSAAYDTIASRFVIFKGLAWSVKAQIMNRVQGIHSALIHDTGRYWTQGNIFPAMAFINRKGARYIPGMHSYRQEVRKAKLLIEMLGILQDATNELDRAKNNSGLRGWTKKANPFYLTEYVEWHNQTPMVLAMLMDQYIESPSLKDEQGNPIKVPIFNSEKRVVKLQGGGTYTLEYGFPAYNVEKGKLILKSDFMSKENRDTWMNFSTKQGSQVYNKIDTALAQMNGDYRKDAAIFAKKGAFGRSMLTFKSWVAMNYYVRFAKDTTNLNLGIKDFDGAYTGALKTGKTSIAGGVALTGVAGLGAIVAGGSALVAVPIGLGLLGYSTWKAAKYKKATGEEAKILLQLTATAQALFKKGIGVPVNLVSGKNLVKAHSFNELNLTPEEKQNLQLIINEMTNVAISMLIFIMYKSFTGDDEEKEPKTMIDPVTGNVIVNPLFGIEKQTAKQKAMNNLIENQLTEFIKTAVQYTNPITTWELFTSPASVDGWFKSATDISEAILKTFYVGPTLQSGPNEGKNRIVVAGVKGTLPGIVGEYILQEDNPDEEVLPYSFGFGNAMKTEYQKNDLIDYWYRSDYKKDRAKFKDQRKDYKKERVKYWEKEYEPFLEQYKEDPIMMDALKKEIESLATQEVNANMPYPNRAFYDESQTKVE
jgi:hypothetical protein